MAYPATTAGALPEVAWHIDGHVLVAPPSGPPSFKASRLAVSTSSEQGRLMAESGKWVSVSSSYITPRSTREREAWAEEAAQRGRTGTQRLVEVGEAVPPAEVAEALNLSAGDLAVVRRRVMLLDDQPVELTDSYYPVEIARGTRLAEPRKVPGGAVTLLAELGYRPTQVSEEVSARRPTDEERRSLALRDDEWVLSLVRTLTADHGSPVEVSVMTMTAEGRHLRYQMAID